MTPVDLSDDGGGAELRRFEGTRANRYTEVFLINLEGDRLLGNVYNTIGHNDVDGTGDTSPDAMLAGLDVEALKVQYGVPGVFLNGPRLWTLDWIDVPVGTTREFNGLQAGWVGKVDLSGMNLKDRGATAYNPTTIERKTEFGLKAGTQVFLLDGPDDRAWVMKSAGLIVDPSQQFDQLEDLGDRLDPADGWAFRVSELDEDLVLVPEAGVAGIVQDELGNTYDLAGPGYSNYKP